MVNSPTRSQRDPVARAVLLVCFGAALYLGLTQPGVPAAARQDVILIATPTIARPEAAPDAAVSAPAAPQATEAPPADTQGAEIVSGPPVAPEESAPIVVDQAPVVEAPAPVVDEAPAMAAPTIDPAPIQAEPDQHGTKAAPDRAAHYNEATNDAPSAPAHTETIQIEQAAADAYRDLPSVPLTNDPTTPNDHPMPRGAGSR